MYLIDFMKSLLCTDKISAVIYLCLNAFITVMLVLLFVPDVLPAIFIGLSLFFIFLTLTMSPIGEFLFRRSIHAVPFDSLNKNDTLYAVFDEICSEATAIDSSIPRRIKFYFYEDTAPAAHAAGRRTICISSSLLSLPVNHIKGVIGHELQHISQHDSDLLLLCCGGNLLIALVSLMLSICIRIVAAFFMVFGFVIACISGIGFISNIAAAVQELEIYIVGIVKYIWFIFGYSLVFQFHRKREYAADEFVARLGYGSYLCESLNAFKHNKSADLVLWQLDSCHPSAKKRIRHLQQLEPPETEAQS